jgi:hypothetical protein
MSKCFSKFSNHLIQLPHPIWCIPSAFWGSSCNRRTWKKLNPQSLQQGSRMIKSKQDHTNVPYNKFL